MGSRNEYNPITILLADDHPLLRKGLRETIEEDTHFSVIAETGNGEHALALIKQHKPAIAVLDIDMPKINGLDVAALLQKKKHPTKIIILTMYNTDNFFNRAMDLGVRGYLLKDNAISEIVDALQRVAEGKFYFTPSLSDLMVQRSRVIHRDAAEQLGLSSLTQTERTVLRLVADNISNKDIADKLFISVRTVETHRNNICQKLNLQGTNALLRFALENKPVL
jgi:DNA-binding NarL/FixJ family response regulator